MGEARVSDTSDTTGIEKPLVVWDAAVESWHPVTSVLRARERGSVAEEWLEVPTVLLPPGCRDGTFLAVTVRESGVRIEKTYAEPESGTVYP